MGGCWLSSASIALSLKNVNDIYGRNLPTLCAQHAITIWKFTGIKIRPFVLRYVCFVVDRIMDLRLYHSILSTMLSLKAK